MTSHCYSFVVKSSFVNNMSGLKDLILQYYRIQIIGLIFLKRQWRFKINKTRTEMKLLRLCKAKEQKLYWVFIVLSNHHAQYDLISWRSKSNWKNISLVWVNWNVQSNLNVLEKCLWPAPFSKRLLHRCFPVNLAKFLRTPFFKEHSRWLLLSLMR